MKMTVRELEEKTNKKITRKAKEMYGIRVEKIAYSEIEYAHIHKRNFLLLRDLYERKPFKDRYLLWNKYEG